MEPERKRFFIISGLIISLSIITVVVFLLFFNDDENIDKDSVGDIEITEIERVEAENVATGFINTVGNWGLKKDTVNTGNLFSILSVVGANNPGVENFWVSRSQQYTTAKQKFLFTDSLIWVDSNETKTWIDVSARDTLSSFEIKDLQIESKDNASVVTIDGVQRKIVTVVASFVSVQTKMTQEATDSSSDGTFIVYEKHFDNEVEILVVNVGSSWKVYDVKGSRTPFVLASWDGLNRGYEEHQFDFIKTGEVKANI